MALQAAFAVLTCLLLIPLSPAKECSYQRAPNSMYYNGSLYIDDSSVKMRWNFQNQMNAIQIYFSSSCTNTTAMEKYYINTVGSCKILDISKATMNTICTVCWYYSYVLNDDRKRYQLQQLNFSFGTYCANRTYDITSSTKSYNISSNSVACFSCSLPDSATPNRWSYKDVMISNSSYFNGSLLISDTSNLFSDSILDSILTCNDTVSMNFLQAHIIFNTPLLPTRTEYLSDGTISSISPSTSSTFSLSASAGFTNPSPSARSVVEYTTKQGLASKSTYKSPYASEGEMSSPAFIIQVTPLLQDNNTIDVKVIIGSSSLMLLIFIFAAVLVVSITIWLSKKKKDVIDLNDVISEHSKLPPQVVHTASVTTELDKLEWELPTAPCNIIKLSCLDSLSLSKCNANADGAAQASIPFLRCQSNTEFSYLHINDICNVSCNGGQEALQPQVPLQPTVCSNPLENSTSNSCSTTDTSFTVEYDVHSQNEVMVLNFHSGYIPDNPQALSVTNAIEHKCPIESPTCDEIHSANMEDIFDSFNSPNDNPTPGYVTASTLQTMCATHNYL